jgi:hypothetical protein
LASVVALAKKLGKATYVLSVDSETGKVAHANYVPEGMRKKGLDARTWAAKVAEVIGGKVSSDSFPAFYRKSALRFSPDWRERRWGAGVGHKRGQGGGGVESGSDVF